MGVKPKKTARDEFTAPIQRKLGERAAYYCSNPLCNRTTVGPSDINAEKSIKTGEAAHICAAAIGGPRYDPNQTPAERASIKNGIWLCAACASLIDKNNGADHPASDLHKWKTSHEKLIRECLLGKWRIPLQMLKSDSALAQCREIIKFLEQKGALYMNLKYEVPHYVIDSMKEIRNYLTALSTKILPGSPLEKMTDAINHACRYYMNSTGNTTSTKHMQYNLGATRKVIGAVLLQMEKTYKVSVPSKLKSIMPNK